MLILFFLDKTPFQDCSSGMCVCVCGWGNMKREMARLLLFEFPLYKVHHSNHNHAHNRRCNKGVCVFHQGVEGVRLSI